MTEYRGADDASTPLAMDQRQFAQLMTTVAAALRQPTAPLSTSQQAVALQFRLLRNGLGRFRSASEAFDRALIRIDQIQHVDWIELVIHDPIPRDARSMVLVVDSQRIPRDLPGFGEGGTRFHRFEGDSVAKVVELVEFLDQFDVPIAAGVPVQIPGLIEDQHPESGSADSDSDFTPQSPRRAPAVSRTNKPQPRS